ncbi:hypothetical protein [Vibrio harveyi]|uniref:hypothetical protein n=1 Tax=Vibrio harveyi TaxID=669 RepID=UPI0018F1F1B8|nr:hypothetical protein [Vibrio harveyi]
MYTQSEIRSLVSAVIEQVIYKRNLDGFELVAIGTGGEDDRNIYLTMSYGKDEHHLTLESVHANDIQKQITEYYEIVAY